MKHDSPQGHRLADQTQYDQLPDDPAQRHEALLEIFGQDVLGHRNNALRSVFKKIENRGSGELPYDKDFFAKAAESLSTEQREICQTLAVRVIADFMSGFMTMLCSHSSNKPLGRNHGIAYHLLLEIESLNRTREESSADENMELEDFDPPDQRQPSATEPDASLEVHELQTGGRLFFPNYWNRWQHKFSDY